MGKDFIGAGHTRAGQTELTSYDVHIEHDGRRYSLTHKVRGSYVAFQWDGGGPGSTDLARALLWEATGADPEWRIYRLFKNEVVAAWPRRIGECWRISEEEIREWLAGVERDMSRAEDASHTEARLERTRKRGLRLKGFTRMFGRRVSN